MKRKKPLTLEHNLYIHVLNDENGLKMLEELSKLLLDFKHKYKKSYLNGWIGPVDDE